MKEKVCSICGKTFTEWGNNAEPINNGICCDNCNMSVVLPQRIKNLDRGKEK